MVTATPPLTEDRTRRFGQQITLPRVQPNCRLPGTAAGRHRGNHCVNEGNSVTPHRAHPDGFATRRRASTARQVLACGAAATLLLACRPAGQPSPPRSATTPSAAVAASSPPAAPRVGAPTPVDAYRGMWQAYIEAIRIPDPNYPDLARYSQADALNLLVRGLTTVQQQGLVGQGDVTLNPSVTAANPNTSPPTVELKDCVDTSKTRLVKKDGSPYQDTPGGKRSAKATVARISDGVWKVTEFAIFGVGTC